MSWWAVVGRLLPLAVANALSTIPLTVTLTVLLGPRRRRTALPFLIGWLAGLVAVTALSIVLTTGVPVESAERERVLGAGTEILIGLALVGVGSLAWRRRDQPRGPRRWGAPSIGSARSALLVGAGLNLRPKELLLCLAAGVAIRNGSLGLVGTLAAGLVFVVLAGASVTGPVLAALLRPERTEQQLAVAKDWLGANGSIVAAVVGWLIGVVVLGDGLARL